MQGPVELIAIVGAAPYARGLAYAQEGRVQLDRHDTPDPHAPDPLPGQRDKRTTHWVKGHALGSGDRIYTVEADFRLSRSGVVTEMTGWCSCPVGMNCKHAVALVIVALAKSSEEEAGGGAPSTRDSSEDWHSTLGTIFRIPEVDMPLALGVELEEPQSHPSAARGGRDRVWGRSDLGTVGQVLVRPLREGKRTRWVTTDVSWARFQSHSIYGADPAQVDSIDRLRQLYVAGNPYDHGITKLRLSAIDNPALWPTMRAIVDSGVQLLEEKTFAPVILEEEPANADITIREGDGDGIHVRAELTHPALVPGVSPVRIGRPLHGIAWRADGVIHLAALRSPATSQWLRLSGQKEGVHVPAQEREAFEREVLPLIARVGWTSPGSSFTPTPPEAPELHLAIGFPSNGARAVLHWSWGADPDGFHAAVAMTTDLPAQLTGTLERGFGQLVSDFAQSQDHARKRIRSARGARGLWPDPKDPSRDAEAETVLLTAAIEVVNSLPALVLPAADGSAVPSPGDSALPVSGFNRGGQGVPQAVRGLRDDAVLNGLDVVTFLDDILPTLREIGVVVDSYGDIPDFREAAVPIIEVGMRQEGPSQDWFDLDISMKVGELQIPMPDLLAALTRHEEAMFLPSGEYVRLNTPEIDRLRQLLEEARGLTDARRAGIRVPRVRQSWWEDLLSLGVIQTATHAWFDSVRNAVAHPPAPAPVPHGLTATLRPYQREGFQWLANLRRSQLGGVLADDMGLGKTVQTLAMIQDEREDRASLSRLGTGAVDRGESGPWLVVAPTSVVPNWAAEARKFTPGLRVATVESTAKRRSTSLSELARHVDILVTSYTLLRLEASEYAALRPCGVVLDEAQQAKNPASKTFTSIARLGAPAVFAITGTPMENNLGELWAVFALTAPGLLGSAKQFGDTTRRPIERGEDDGTRMTLLRRRIAPFLLRRTKEEVATDLPEKQEQVLAVELTPPHRRIYERHLARVRQSVLRLADDLDGNRVQVLAALTRLRQLAIDPALIEEPDAPGLSEVQDLPDAQDVRAHQADASSKLSGRKSDIHSKLDVLVPLLHEAAEEGHRTLVFSQFTRYLRMISQRLTEEGIEFVYLDGTTTNRGEVISDFAEGTAPVFLISLKAGGVGLNLTMADYVVLTDPWWNPAVEAQAVDRTHRIGQVNPVHVYRLVSQGTIEEKVLSLQESKRELVAEVLASDVADSDIGGDVAGTGREASRGGVLGGQRRDGANGSPVRVGGSGGAKLSAEDLRLLLS